MDKGKKPGNSNAILKNKTNMIYMDLGEIIREHALRYLPAKSLYRFNAVCRDWKLQISIPFFAHSQSFAFCTLSGLFCQTPDGSISFISFDQLAYGIPDPQLKFLPEPVDVLSSSHGLLCCRGRSGEMPYYICNPVRQVWKKLPKPEADHGPEPAVVLVFEPSLFSFMADYKLVCAFCSSDFEGAYEFEVYSSIEDSWKISPEVCFGENGRVLKAGGVYANGIVYWLSNNHSIIGFDVKKNRIKVIPFPSYDVHGYHSLGIMDGKICTSRKRGSQITIYMLSNEFANTMHMGAESKTWEKKQVVLTNNGGASSELGESQGIVLNVARDVIVFPGVNKIFCHDLRIKETKSVKSEVEFSTINVYVPYVNSLVSLEL